MSYLYFIIKWRLRNGYLWVFFISEISFRPAGGALITPAFSFFTPLCRRGKYCVFPLLLVFILLQPLEASVARGLIDGHYPDIQSYVERIHQQPAYQSALFKGGKYDYV